jgi:hypothetical protein
MSIRPAGIGWLVSARRGRDIAMSGQGPTRVYQVGEVVNGHVWTGTQWLPIQVRSAPPAQHAHAATATPLRAFPVQPRRKRYSWAIWLLVALGGLFVVFIAAAIAIPVFLNARGGADSSKATLQSDLMRAGVAVEAYWAGAAQPPSSVDDLFAVGFRPSAGVTIALASLSDNAYCLEGTLEGTWAHYSSATGVGDGVCP